MEIINDKTNEILKRMKREIFIRLLSSSIIFVAFVVLLFIFQSRKYQILFIILLGTITSVFLGYLLFVITQYIQKRKAYGKFLLNVKRSSKTINDIEVLSEEKKHVHVMGIETRVYKVKELDTKKEFNIYIDEYHKDKLNVEEKYEIVTYHGFLLSYERKES